MSLKILAGDFKSGSTDLTGFHLQLCNEAVNLVEFFPLSRIKTLEEVDDIREIINREEWVGTATSEFEAFAKLLTEGETTYVPFMARFNDDRKMIALADVEEWNQLIIKDRILPYSTATFEKHCSYADVETIDWAAAAPSWSSLVVGAIFPGLAVVALIFSIDAVLCLLLQQWVGHFWTIPLWLTAAMLFPFALVGAIALAGLFLQISSGGWQSGLSKQNYTAKSPCTSKGITKSS
jgi:hypothetical protein